MMSFLMQSLCHFDAVEYVLKLQYVCVSCGISSTRRALPFALQKLEPFGQVEHFDQLAVGTPRDFKWSFGGSGLAGSSLGDRQPADVQMLRCS